MAKEKPKSEPETKKLDETIPGGAYLINGVLVNAEGEPLNGESTESIEPPKE